MIVLQFITRNLLEQQFKIRTFLDSYKFLRTVKKNMPTIGTLSLLLDGIYFSL